MSNKYDAIIIGSGVGGSGIGALLAHAGWKVLILEKNKLPGGRCITYQRDKYLLDLGWHFFCLGAKGPLQKICDKVDMPDGIPWNTVKSSFFQVGDTARKYCRKSMIEAVPVSERENFEKIFTAIFRATPQEIDHLWYVPVKTWLGGFTGNPMANTIIESFVCQYFCIPSTVASAAEFINAFRQVMELKSTAYPDGGNIAVPRAYLNAVEKYGGQIKCETEVKNILVENQTAVGVVLADGTQLRAPVVISNADIRATVLNLAGQAAFPPDYIRKIKSLTYSVHAVTFKTVVTQKVTDKQVVIYIPDDHSPPLLVTEQMKNGQVPDLVGGCYCSPTNFDSTMAPEGMQLLTSLHGCPPDIENNLDQWKKTLLNSMLRVFPEAEGKIAKIYVDTPRMVNALAGEGGNIIGVAQTVDQVHERRPSVVSPLNGLYFSSAEAGGHGIGTELAASSAIELFSILNAK